MRWNWSGPSCCARAAPAVVFFSKAFFLTGDFLFFGFSQGNPDQIEVFTFWGEGKTSAPVAAGRTVANVAIASLAR